MKKLTRFEVLAEALNCDAFQADGSSRVTFEVDDLMKFVSVIVRESTPDSVLVSAHPLAVLRYQRGTPGRENEMPEVVSCANWLPDGEYPVYLGAEPSPSEWRVGYSDGSGTDCITAGDDTTIMRGGDSFGAHFGFRSRDDLQVAVLAPELLDAARESVRRLTAVLAKVAPQSPDATHE